MNEHPLHKSASGVGHEDRWRVVLVLVVSGAIWGFLALCGHLWLIYPDSMEYAQTARNLSEGRGAVTETIWTLRTAYPMDIPPVDIRRPLLWPGILSLVFRMAGAGDASAILASGLMGCLAAGLLYLLARRSLGPLESFVATIVFSFQSQVILMNQSGLSEPLFTVILLLICLTLVRANRPWQYLAGGVLTGLSQWVRLNGFWLTIPIAVWLLWRREKGWRKRLVLFFAGAAIVFLPLAIRNWKHIGAFSIVGLPGASIVGEIPPFPDHGAERWLEPIPVFHVLASNPGMLLKKYILGLSKNLNALFGSVHPLLWGLFLIPLLRREGEPLVRRLSLFALAILALFLLSFSIGEFEGPRFYEPLAALVVLGGVAGLKNLLAREGSADDWIRTGRGAIILFILILPGLFHLYQSALNPPEPGFRRQLGGLIQEIVPPGAVVVSDTPWATGWYGRRLSIWLPLGIEEIEVLNRRLPIRYLALTSSVTTADWNNTVWPIIFQQGHNLPAYRRVFPPKGLGPVQIFERQIPPGGGEEAAE